MRTMLESPCNRFTKYLCFGTHREGELSSHGYQTGRPRIDVSKEDILALRRLNYSWTKIARIMEISRQTLYRRLENYGISMERFVDISSSQLDSVLEDVKAEHPNAGEVMLKGHLLQQGITIPREKLREAIHRVDHENTVNRRSVVIKRRVYSVTHPNALWHIDGNHKMIRWRLVVHAGVDGFSRSVVYIKCANNNRAATVLASFMEGLSVFGMPDRVRSDHGGENIDVWRHMISVHNNQSCVLTGSSTHNERVERLWRDVRHDVTSAFINTFWALESEGMLDPLNEVDIFCLHFVFLPRVNKCLCDFQGAWNQHALSTEGNMSPLQLFVEGATACALNEEEQSSQQPISTTPHPMSPDDLDSVQVPANKFVPCTLLSAVLLAVVDPMSQCSDLGKSLYCTTVHVVGQHLQEGCITCKFE